MLARAKLGRLYHLPPSEMSAHGLGTDEPFRVTPRPHHVLAGVRSKFLAALIRGQDPAAFRNTRTCPHRFLVQAMLSPPTATIHPATSPAHGRNPTL